jgi:hypothetical protein
MRPPRRTATLVTLLVLAALLGTPPAGADPVKDKKKPKDDRGPDRKEYWVDGERGSDEPRCVRRPAPGEGACRTVGYVLRRESLRGATVHVAPVPRPYREAVVLGPEHSGTAEAPTVITADGGKAILEGLDPVPLDDRAFVPCGAAEDCDGNGQQDVALRNVYRAKVAGRKIAMVHQTGAWAPITVVDRGGSADGVSFRLTFPIPYRNAEGKLEVGGACASPLACLELIAGTYLVDGPWLYVHPYGGENPATSPIDLETSPPTPQTEGSVVLVTGHHVVLDGLVVRYGGTLVQVRGSHVGLRRVDAYSASAAGITFRPGAEFGEVRDVSTHHVYSRRNWSNADFKGFCFGPECGWQNKAGGYGFKVDGGSGPGAQGTRGMVVVGLTAYNSWNAAGLEQVRDGWFEDGLFKNSFNHLLTVIGNGVTCTNNRFKRIVTFNGQDGLFVNGCVNGRVWASIPGLGLVEQKQSSPPFAPSSGWYHGGNIAAGISMCRDGNGDGIGCGTGFRADFDWLPDSTACKWDRSPAACRTEFRERCGCERRFSAGRVALRRAKIPIGRGLAVSELVREDFYPTADSTGTIDKGDPDLNGDGVVENGPGGADACTASNRCAGAGPDIGPFEFGIDR